MKKPFLTLGVLAGVLVVLIAGNLVIGHISDKKAAEKESQSEAESIAKVVKVSTLSDLAKISFQNLTFQYTKADGWTYDGDKAFPLDADKISTIANSLKNLTSSRKLENGDTLENYGLKTPKYSVTLTDSKGKTEVLNIGNAIDSEYYVMVGDDSSVIYTCAIDNVAYLGNNLLSFAKIDNIIADWTSDPTEIDIATASQSMKLTKTKSADTKVSGSKDEWQVSLNNGASYKVENTTELDAVKTALQLTYTSCVAYNVGDKDLGTYGLDNPTYSITIHYLDTDKKAQTLTIKIGAYSSQASSFAVMSSKSKQVYAMDSSAVTAIAQLFGYDFKKDTTKDTTKETTASK